MILLPPTQTPDTARGAWGIFAVLGAFALIGAVALAITMVRATPEEPGLSWAWGRYGPTQSLAERGASDGEWLLYCRRDATECRPRARQLCGGDFQATILPRPASGYLAVAEGWRFGAFGGLPRSTTGPPAVTLRDAIEHPERLEASTRLIAFRNGNRILCGARP